ncbi:MAG: DUF2341 domain-containing protein, partial [Bacteroidales bacterium]
MRFNDAGKFNTKAFNSDKLFDMGDLAATVTNAGTWYEDLGLENYLYRKSHIIAGVTGEQTNYPVKIVIYRSTGSDTGEDVYISTKCKEDYSDIRFTDSDGSTLLDYWIESSDASSATVWVEVPTIPSEDNATIYLYYGYSEATDGSSGADTFTYFSDCSDLTGHTYSNTTVDSGAFKTANLNSGQWYRTTDTMGTGYALRMRQKQTPLPTSVVGTYFGSPFGPMGDQLYFYYATSGEVKGYNQGSTGLIIESADTDYHIFEIQRDTTPRFVVDGTDYGTIGSSNTNALSFGAKYGWASWVNYGYTDWYVVRKFVYPEPTHGDWGSEQESIYHAGYEFEFILTQETTVSNSPAATFLWTFPDFEETISNDPELTHSIFVNTTPIFTIDFDSGSSEITVGETVTGATSGATGTVLAVELSSGSWEGGDAAGTIQIQDADGLFVDNEELDGSVAGDSAASADGEATRVTSKIYDKSVWKGIDDAYWSASVLMHGYFSFTENANFRELMITMKDHSDTDQTVFYGYIPDQGLTYDKNEYTTKLDAYSHARNLVDQYIPEADRNTVTWVPSGSTGYTTFLEPSVVVTTLLGGSASWNTTTGIKPYSINTVTDWGTASIPQRGWVWGPETTRWQAIMEMCDYLGWTFDTYYDATNDWQAGAFCDLDDIDTYLGIPAAVTFTKTDTPKYVMSVKKEKRGTEKINRVRVQGKRNKRRLNFITGTVEFTADHVVVDGGTGATATIVSCTKTSGTWGSDAAGYLIISYDRTGDFVDGDTIID